MAKGDFRKARELFIANLELSQRTGSRYGLGIVNRDLGVLHFFEKDYKESIARLRTSLNTLQRIQSSEADEVEAMLGQVLIRSGTDGGEEIIEKYKADKPLILKKANERLRL